MTEDVRCPMQRQPMELADLFADPHETLRQHRDVDWWTTVPDLEADCIALTHADARDLLAAADLHADLRGFILRMLRLNGAVAPELVDHYAHTHDTFLVLNGEPHRRLRALFSRAFTARQVDRITPFMDATADRLALTLRPGDDFVAGFAARYPGLVLCELTGIPDADRDEFVAWVDTVQEGLSTSRLLSMTRDDSLRLLAAEKDLAAYTASLVRRRRRDPGDDLVSRLTGDPDSHLTDGELAASIAALIIAGNDTTRCLLGLVMLAAAEHPEIWDRVADDGELAAALVEETLRFEGPVFALPRETARPLSHRDCDLDAGAHAMVSLWAANRDPAVYDRPDAFEPERWSDNPPATLAFGHGTHYCLGASLARAETRIAVSALARHLRNPRVLEVDMRPTGSILGPERLLVDFDPLL